MALLTNGFRDSAARDDHFQRHGWKVGASSAAEYEAKADAFLAGPKSATCQEGTRKAGDIVRFDPATKEFGVLGADGKIKTYLKPSGSDTAAHLEYFRRECSK